MFNFRHSASSSPVFIQMLSPSSWLRTCGGGSQVSAVLTVSLKSYARSSLNDTAVVELHNFTIARQDDNSSEQHPKSLLYSESFCHVLHPYCTPRTTLLERYLSAKQIACNDFPPLLSKIYITPNLIGREKHIKLLH